MKWRLGFLALVLFSALVTVIVSQNETITEQRAMIRSFYDDPVCMHDPRVTK